MTDLEYKQAIDAAIRDHPSLTLFGFGVFNKKQDFDSTQAELYEGKDMFEKCVEFIRLVGLRKTLNRNRTSYGLKHDCEDWASTDLRHFYVANGMFIAALHYSGAKVSRWDREANATTNLRKVKGLT